MRALMIHPGPHFSVADVYTGWAEALRGLGVQVQDFNLGDRLTFYESAMLEVERDASDRVTVRKALEKDQAVQLAINGLFSSAYQFWPDVIFIVSGFFMEPEKLDLLRGRGHRLVLLCTEQPYETSRELKLAEHADLVLLNDPTNLDQFRAITRAEYVPHAYRPSIHYAGPGTHAYAADLAFVGTGYPSRVEFLEAMALDGLDVFLAGNWQILTDESPLRPYLAHEPDQCLDNPMTAEVYRSATVGLNLYRREAETTDVAGWAMGPREVEMAACGMFYLRDRRPEGDELLPMLPTFSDPAEAGELLRWWLAHPDERREAAALARMAVRPRTFHNHAAAALRLLDRVPVRA